MRIGLKHLVFFFLTFCFSRNYFPQNTKPIQVIDSLKKILNEYDRTHPADNPTLADTVRIKLLNKLALQYFKISDNYSMYRNVSRANELCLKLLAIPSYSANYTLKKEFGRSYHYLSNYYEVAGMIPKAFDNYFKAVKVREEVGDLNDIAESTLKGGNLYKNEGDLDKALHLYIKALEVREKILKSEPRNRGNIKGIAGGYNNIGLLYQKRGDWETALRYFFKSLQIKESLGDKLSAANSLANIGLTYTKMLKFDLSLNYSLRALEIYQHYNDKRGACYTYFNIAQNYFDEVIMTNDPAKNMHMGAAKENIDHAMQIAKDIRDAGALKDCYLMLSNIAEINKDYPLAMSLYKLHMAYRDSVNSTETMQNIVRAQMNNEFERKEFIAHQKQELNNALHQQEHERQKRLRNLFIVAFAGMVIFAVLIFRGIRQKQKDNVLISEQKKEVELQKSIAEQKQKQIIDSINYAQRIQSSILPHHEDLQKITRDSFIFYSPKHIVSGDFYWFHALSPGKIMVAVADCTGHGVPGAFLSMVGSTLLSEIVIHKKITDPAQIIKDLAYGVSLVLINKEQDEADRDGMDVTICMIDTNLRSIKYASSNQVIYVAGKNGLLKIEPQIKSGEGIFDLNKTKTLAASDFVAEENAVLYFMTDGLKSELNPVTSEKFGTTRIEKLFAEINHLPLNEQQKIVQSNLSDWKNNSEQEDDILILGIRI